MKIGEIVRAQEPKMPQGLNVNHSKTSKTLSFTVT